MSRTVSLAFLLLLCLTACSPRVGFGIGGVVASSDGVAVSEVVVDTQSGVHGSVSTGTKLGL